METVQLGVPRCRVQVFVPLHPDHPEWADLSTDVMSVQLLETLEVASLGVLNSFCTQHPDEVSTSLVGLLPAVGPEDPVWRHRMGHMADLLAVMRPLDALQEMVRREGALYRLQALRSAASTAVTASALDSAESWECAPTTCALSRLATWALSGTSPRHDCGLDSWRPVRPTGWHVTLSGSTYSLTVSTPSWDCMSKGSSRERRWSSRESRWSS
jgi:hypothetical protein